MKPRHLILLLDINEDRRSLLRCVLETAGHYKVIPIMHPTESVELDAHPRLLIAVWPFEVAATMALRRVLDRPLLVIANKLEEVPIGLVANQVLLKDQGTIEKILEAVKILTTWKRGPRPKGQYPAELQTANEARSRGTHGAD
jgi:hypothetical protein